MSGCPNPITQQLNGTDMNEKQQKAMVLARETRDHKLYNTHEKENQLFGMLKMAIDLGAWSQEMEDIWRGLRPRDEA